MTATSSGPWRKMATSIPSRHDRSYYVDVLQQYVASWNTNDVQGRLELFGDDAVFEDPAGLRRSSNKTELTEFFLADVPSDWTLDFKFVRCAVVGDEAIVTYTVDLRAGERSPSTLFVNSHVQFDATGRIGSIRVFYDVEAVTDH
jgi:ketosteroid isomerase-like protein